MGISREFVYLRRAKGQNYSKFLLYFLVRDIKPFVYPDFIAKTYDIVGP